VHPGIDPPISSLISLMNMPVINDLGERHIIGTWWKDFTAVKVPETNYLSHLQKK
jgi:hypothetical protein